MSNQNICNICGANYEYIAGRWKCPACGAFKAEELSNEEVTLIYNAAQKLRLCDFNEAEIEYTDIIDKFPNNPEGYWGRLLARYGIKYEEDFDGRRIPTCYAASIKSVFGDWDYEMAMSLFSEADKDHYKAQAEYIERVRKEWIEKASKEEPYDIFLCYKDSDLANGIDRTPDSIAVQDLYIHLTEQGYRVFYSRESLRDKVGEKYEPYIFNALSTAKVMLVYGSKPEYITSTWLKNEWTRYIKRMQAGEKLQNSLMIACDGFSPDLLPSSLSSRQCFDATKRSFYSDLDKVIKKIIKGEEKTENSEKNVPEQSLENNKPIKKTKKALIITLVVFAFLTILGMILDILNGKETSMVENTEYGITITADDNIFNKDTTVSVNKFTDGSKYKSLISTVEAAKSITTRAATIYDIDCNEEFDKTFRISIKYSKIHSDSELRVYYVSDDEAIVTEHSCFYENKTVIFETDHLSYYIICELTGSQVIPDDSEGGESDSDDNKGDQSSGDNSDPDSDSTGDSDTPVESLSSSVIFNANGGEGTMDAQSVTVGVQSTLNKCTFTKNGFTFGGWSSSSGGSAIYTDEAAFVAVSEEIATLYAVWIPNLNSVIFNAGGGSGIMESLSVQTGQTVALPSNIFTKPGYNFIGWSSTSGGSVEYTDGSSFTMVVSSATLYAIWEANTNSVTFNSNGGSGTMSIQQAKTDEKVTLKPNSFTREGYTFAGWATSSSGNVIYADQAAYTMGSDSNYTLYAIWIKATYTITYHMNGGSNNTNNPAGYDVTDATIILADPTRLGYTFKGWYSDSGFSTEVTTINTNDSKNISLYAKWEIINYTITYVLNGSTNNSTNPSSYTVASGNITLADPTRKGFAFRGWYSDPEATTKVTIINTNNPKDITLYARWEIIDYTITYILNGGTNSSSNPTSYNVHSGSITLSAPTRAEHIFKGWYTDSEFITKVTTIATTELKNITLYAKWETVGFKHTVANGEVTITDFAGEGDVVIPAEIEGLPVTKIGDSAFAYCDIQSITIPSSVKTIGVDAFYDCDNLKNVTIENGVEVIEQGAFDGCDSLESLTIPGSVKAIGIKAFYYCDINNIVLEYGVEAIDEWAFGCSTRLTSITIPASVKSIGQCAFYECENLQSVTMTNGVESIGKQAFYRCLDAKITIPASLKTIGDEAFFQCNGIESVTVPESLESIGAKAFAYCAYITNVTVKSGVKRIGDYMFSSCSSLKNLTIENGVELIGEGAFEACSTLEAINIPSSVTSIGNGAFALCTRLKSLTIPGNVTSIGDSAFAMCYELENVTIENGVKTIGDQAFAMGTKLKSITIPQSVNFIGKEAFIPVPTLTPISQIVFDDPTGWHYTWQQDETTRIIFDVEESTLSDPSSAASFVTTTKYETFFKH